MPRTLARSHIASLTALREALAPEIADLPRLSAMIDGFLARGADSTASVGAITAGLAAEPALAAWVLRQANSGYQGLARAVGDCGEACVVLGLEPVTRLVYAACSRDLLLYDPAPYPGPARGPWLHGLATAAATTALARLLGVRSPLAPEAARVAGLLHDAGKRLVAGRWPAGAGEAPATPAHERQRLGFDHAAASAALARTWELPPAIVTAVANHHDPAPEGGAALVHAADVLMNAWSVGAAPYPRPDATPPHDELVGLVTRLGGDEDLVARWCDALPPVISGLDEMLRWSQRPSPPARPAPDMPAASGASGEPETDGSRTRRSRRSHERDRRSRRAGRRDRRR